ncbi:MAG: amidohydrolase family protein [Microscillaceae bacterium]|jgi:N-acyl-D-aspartate/D-glutamate deacylase|nr:amidohydrolase family protein [Microscillaceae bacterium]
MANRTIIRNGLFFDGTGAPGKKVDVLLQNGKVAEISNQIPAIEGAKEIDATNCWVTPGFLDIHTHYDAEVEVLPGLDESVRHGTTTVVFGNCSLSTALGTEQDAVDLFSRVENMPIETLKSWVHDKFTWKTTKEYYDHLEKLPLGPNVATFLGHSNLRVATMGFERSLKVHKASADELQKMDKALTEALDNGYLGLSIDMLPLHRVGGVFHQEFKGISVPSQQAHVSEYRRLANIVRRYDRVLQATPNAMDKMSVVRLLGISSGWFRKPLRTTIVAALDVKSDPKVQFLAPFLANFANNFLRANIRWQALAEPFLNYADGANTPLFEEFATTATAIGSSSAERKKMFADTTFRAQFKKEWYGKHNTVFHRQLDDMWVVSSPNASHNGKSFAQIAQEAGKSDVLEHFMDLIAEYDEKLRWKSAVANHRPKQRLKLLADKTTIPGFNDSGAHNSNMAFQDGALQVLKQAQANPEVLPIEKAIYRLTKMAADWIGFQAGSLLKGDRADVVVLDPSKLQTNLSEPIEDYDPRLGGVMRMVKRSDGVIKNVFIAGEEVFTEGKFSEDFGKKKFGSLLRATR